MGLTDQCPGGQHGVPEGLLRIPQRKPSTQSKLLAHTCVCAEPGRGTGPHGGQHLLGAAEV